MNNLGTLLDQYDNEIWYQDVLEAYQDSKEE